MAQHGQSGSASSSGSDSDRQRTSASAAICASLPLIALPSFRLLLFVFVFLFQAAGHDRRAFYGRERGVGRGDLAAQVSPQACAVDAQQPRPGPADASRPGVEEDAAATTVGAALIRVAQSDHEEQQIQPRSQAAIHVLNTNYQATRPSSYDHVHASRTRHAYNSETIQIQTQALAIACS